MTFTIVVGDGPSGLCAESERKQPEPAELPC